MKPPTKGYQCFLLDLFNILLYNLITGMWIASTGIFNVIEFVEYSQLATWITYAYIAAQGHIVEAR